MTQNFCVPFSDECKACVHHGNCIVLRAAEEANKTKDKNKMFWELLREEHDQMA